MPRASAAAAAETARDILSAAVGLFAQQGFAAVRLDEVAASASVTRGAVYHHYKNKLGLFTAVAGHLQQQVAEHVVATAETVAADPATQLRAGSHAFVDAITAPAKARILLVDAPAVLGWTTWREMDAQNSAAHLREALRAAGVSDALLDATAAQLSGAMNEAALWITETNDDDAPAAAHQVLDQLIDAVLP